MRTLAALVALQVVASVGTLAWWVFWFASGSWSRGEPCALAYENAFPLGDLVMAGAVGVSAWWIHRRDRRALTLGFVAAGMALSLATLDTTHNLLTGGFDGPLSSVLRKLVFAVVNGAVGLWTLIGLPRHADAFEDPPSQAVPPALGALVALLGGIAVGGAGALAVLEPVRPACVAAIERSFLGPVVGLLALGVVASRAARGDPTRPEVLASGGLLLHAGLVLGAFSALQRLVPDALVAAALLVAGGALAASRTRA